MSKENNLTDFLTDLASAIRDKRGKADFINAQDFASEVRAIEPLLDTLNITSNGKYDVKNYKNINADVHTDDWQYVKMYIERNGVSNYIIPAGITIIGDRLFAQAPNSSKTIKVTFEDKSLIKKIGAYAFENSREVPIGLEDMENVEEIGDYALSYNSGSGMSVLSKQLNYPKLKKIGRNAFYNRSYWSGSSISGVAFDLNFPELEEIKEHSFTTLYINSINFPKINKLPNYCFERCVFSNNFILPSNITELGNYCFNQFKMLKTIDLSNVTILGKNCFDGTSYNNPLEKVILCENLKKIPSYCFRYCANVTEITIPKSVEEIEDAALQIGSSSNKATITMESETPCTITATSFTKSSLNKIYVPKGTSATYKSATNWSTFADYIYEKYIVLFNIPSALVNNEAITYSIDGGKTYQQFTNAVLSLPEVATIKIKSTDASQTILIGTTSGGNDVGTISNSELTFSFTTDTNVYLTIQ